jgi:hypothetical protein
MPYDTPSQAYRTLPYHVRIPLKPLTPATRTPRFTDIHRLHRKGGLCSQRCCSQANSFKWNAHIRSFGTQLEPRYIFRAGRLDQ